jgi:DNA modification methylase
VAALELGRFYIGIEQDPAYLDLSRARLDAALAASG